MPPSFERVDIQGRDQMVRAVISRLVSRHEDFAIVSIEPLPEEQVTFTAIRNTIIGFLEGHEGVRVANIQPSTLGQALVKFEYLYDRDRFVNASSHDFNGFRFWIVKHNEGRNYRGVEFNRECWLMLMGFPLDYWNINSI